MSEIENILGQLGIQHKRESGEIRINCPQCQDTKYHLYVDPVEKVFYCQKCSAKGTWSQLMKELRPSITPLSRDKRPVSHPDMEYIRGCHKRLMGPSGTKAIEYLYSRKFSLKAIQDFYLGLEAKDGVDWLVIPYFKDGKPVNVKYRTLPPAEKGFRRWTGGESILFNQDCLKGDHKEVFLVEGELDCIALYSQGYKNVVSTTIGASGFKPEWVDLLDRFPRVTIVYDSDERGREGAREVSKRLGVERCYNVLLPTKDANDFFISQGDRASFEELAAKGEPFEVENIIDLQKAVAVLKQGFKRPTNGIMAPQWPSVSKLTGPYEPGDLVVLSGTPKTGKTTFALNEALHRAKKGLPVLFYCLEMRPERLIKKVLQMELLLTEEELTPEKKR